MPDPGLLLVGFHPANLPSSGNLLNRLRLGLIHRTLRRLNDNQVLHPRKPINRSLVRALFTHEPAGVVLKSRFAELSTLDPTFPGQFRKPLPASRCESAASSWRCRSNTAFSSAWLIWRNRWVRVQLVSQCGEFLVNSFSFRFESLDCQLGDSTICHSPSISQSAASCTLRVHLCQPALVQTREYACVRNGCCPAHR